ncbi:MAG: iron-containing alcohol dehydrogenase [Candidatus Aenigmatarchaeota archaeon]|nr:MAG: iron-containing alcohol dehydrogenase [Candidatus Aenigmarchaeota archaeon]
MLSTSLLRILRATGRTSLEGAVRHAGTRFVYCASEERLVETLPRDGSGLAVLTDNSFMLDYLKKLGVYKEERIFSVQTESVETVDTILAMSRPTTVMGFGGGRVLDVAKMVAFRSGAPLVSVPTAPTHDGLLSRNCALINGTKKSYPTKYPVKIVIPEYLWKKSGELQKAGRLDVLSDVMALQDVSLAMAESSFVPDNRHMSMAAEAALRVLNEHDEDDLAEALFLSGLAMHDSSRYCSGAEHELEKLLAPFLKNGYFHGQLVGTSTLLTALVYKHNASQMPAGLFFDASTLFDELIELFEERDLLGYVLRPLEENSPEQVAELLKKASAVRPERYTLWNKVPSQKVEWIDMLKEVTALGARASL